MDPDVRATPEHGIGQRAGEPKRVVIIGGGIAGLVAAGTLTLLTASKRDDISEAAVLRDVLVDRLSAPRRR